MCGWKVGGDYLSFNLFPRRPHRTVCAPQVTAPEGIPLLGALPRRGHEEGLSSGRRATGNPEAVGSAALFKDGGGGTSAAEAGAAWQRLGRYRSGEGRPAWARGGDAGWPVPEERPGVGRPVAKRADGPFLRHLPPSPSQWKEALSRPPAGRASERGGPTASALLPRSLPGRGLGRPAQHPAPSVPGPGAGLPGPQLSRPGPCSQSRASSGPGCPPSPEPTEPGGASNYAGLRSTKDWVGRWGCCGRPGVVSGRRCVPLRAAAFVSGRAPSSGFAASFRLSRHCFLRPLKSWTFQNDPTLFFSPLS